MIEWLKQRKKAIAAALAAAPAIAAYWAPDLSGDDVKKAVGTAVLILGVLGVHHVRNADRFRRARR